MPNTSQEFWGQIPYASAPLPALTRFLAGGNLQAWGAEW